MKKMPIENNSLFFDGRPATKPVVLNGAALEVKRYLSVAEQVKFTAMLADNCFLGAAYVPAMFEVAKRMATVEFYSNVTLPENMEEVNRLMFGCGLYEAVRSGLDDSQLRALESAAKEQIDILCGQMAPRPLEQVGGALSALLEKVGARLDGLDAEALASLVAAAAAQDKKPSAPGAVKAAGKTAEKKKAPAKGQGANGVTFPHGPSAGPGAAMSAEGKGNGR